MSFPIGPGRTGGCGQRGTPACRECHALAVLGVKDALDNVPAELRSRGMNDAADDCSRERILIVRPMKSLIVIISIIAALLWRPDAVAESPPMETPPAPAVSALEAVRLADEYVKKTFPEFPDLYCAELTYDSQRMKPDPTIMWRLRYLLPRNARKENAGNPFGDWGACLIFVHEQGRVSHGIAPKRNGR